MHRDTYHLALSVFDSGPEVIVAGRLMVSRDATGDNRDQVRAEWIQQQ